MLSHSGCAKNSNLLTENTVSKILFLTRAHEEVFAKFVTAGQYFQYTNKVLEITGEFIYYNRIVYWSLPRGRAIDRSPRASMYARESIGPIWVGWSLNGE